jgi:hypothetical protein
LVFVLRSVAFLRRLALFLLLPLLSLLLLGKA